jgi:hypothetical protein
MARGSYLVPSRRTLFYSRLLAFFFSFLWAGVLAGMLIGKLVLEGFESYSIHFTNWNWTISTVFFLLDVLAYADPSGIIRNYVHTFAFWVANGSAWLVFWLVFIMFKDNDQVLMNLWTGNGGRYSMSFLINMNAIFHYVPAVFMLIYFALNNAQIAKAVHRILKRPKRIQRSVHIAMVTTYVVIVLGTHLFFIGMYDVFADIKAVYGLTTNFGFICLTALGVSIVFNGLPLILLMSYKIKERT